MWYNFFLLKVILAIRGLLWVCRNFRIICSSSENAIGFDRDCIDCRLLLCIWWKNYQILGKQFQILKSLFFDMYGWYILSTSHHKYAMNQSGVMGKVTPGQGLSTLCPRLCLSEELVVTSWGFLEDYCIRVPGTILLAFSNCLFQNAINGAVRGGLSSQHASAVCPCVTSTPVSSYTWVVV